METPDWGNNRILRQYTPTAVLWQQGENDTGNATSQASYSASLASVITTMRAAGYAGPVFIAQSSWIGGAVSANVVAAQAAVNHGANVWAGPNTDAFNATFRIGEQRKAM